MQSSSDLNQALQSLQLETKKDLEEIHAKEEMRRHAEQDNVNLENEIQKLEADIRTAEQTILKMKQEIGLKKRKMEEARKIIVKSTQDVSHLQNEARLNQTKLTNAERDYREGLAQANKMFKNGGINGTKHY